MGQTIDQETFEGRMRRALKFISSAPDRFNASLGLELVDCHLGTAEGELPEATYSYTKKKGHTNQYDGVHGGVVSALLDTVEGVTASAFAGSLLTTTDLSVSFVRPMMGDHFYIRAKVTRVGSHLINMTGSIVDTASGKEQATSMATYYILQGEPILAEDANLDLLQE